MNVGYFFSPAVKLEALVKNRAFGCKVVMIDLEDAVHFSEKQNARSALEAFDFSKLDSSGIRFGLRLNTITSIEGIRDIELLHRLYRRGRFPVEILNVPKIRNHHDLLTYKALFDDFPAETQVMPLIETVEAIDDIDEIARNSDALLFGQADLTAGMFSPNEHFISYARARLCIAAAKYCIIAVDTNSFELHDLTKLERECLSAKQDGFMAKAVIHPNQIETIERVFSVSVDEIRDYQSTIDIYHSSKTGFAIKDGKVIAPPFITKARKMLDYFEYTGASATHSQHL